MGDLVRTIFNISISTFPKMIPSNCHALKKKLDYFTKMSSLDDWWLQGLAGWMQKRVAIWNRSDLSNNNFSRSFQISNWYTPWKFPWKTIVGTRLGKEPVFNIPDKLSPSNKIGILALFFNHLWNTVNVGVSIYCQFVNVVQGCHLKQSPPHEGSLA